MIYLFILLICIYHWLISSHHAFLHQIDDMATFEAYTTENEVLKRKENWLNYIFGSLIYLSFLFWSRILLTLRFDPLSYPSPAK